MDHRLPSFIIIGAMKAGTTSLHHYLDLHPEISMSKVKEPNFFIDRNWHKGLSWYRRKFKNNHKVKGEASPEYSKYPFFQHVPQRIHQTLPHVKIIYMVREPIKRVVSHLYHDRRKTRIRYEKVDEIIRTTSNPYVTASQYYYQLEQYFPYFSKEQILLATAEELKNDPTGTLKRIFAFLEVDQQFYTPSFETQKHQSEGRKLLKNSYLHELLKHKFYYNYLTKTGLLPTVRVDKPQLSEEMLKYLKKAFANDISRLESFIGRELEEWGTSKAYLK